VDDELEPDNLPHTPRSGPPVALLVLTEARHVIVEELHRLQLLNKRRVALATNEEPALDAGASKRFIDRELELNRFEAIKVFLNAAPAVANQFAGAHGKQRPKNAVKSSASACVKFDISP
jgi:hypothetical protein